MWIYDNNGSYIGFTYNGVEYYYVYNLQGDVEAITDAEGTIVAKYEYDEWGYVEYELNYNGAVNISEINPIRYRGYYYDSERGLYYLNSRYYDPFMCRFINADGYVSTGQGVTGYNMFAYCGNNPVNRKDPSGQGWIAALIATAVVVAVCTIAFSGCSKPPAGPNTNSSSNSTTSKNDLTPSQKETQLIVAQTIYGEEHGRTIHNDWQQGQQAVAAVIANRQSAGLSYLGEDLETICTNGQFDGYFSGKKAYESSTCDAVAWDSAMSLAECVVTGQKIDVPYGITSNHLYFNATRTYNNNVNKNGGMFSFGQGTEPVTPKGVITYGGNTFFYY